MGVKNIHNTLKSKNVFHSNDNLKQHLDSNNVNHVFIDLCQSFFWVLRKRAVDLLKPQFENGNKIITYFICVS